MTLTVDEGPTISRPPSGTSESSRWAARGISAHCSGGARDRQVRTARRDHLIRATTTGTPTGRLALPHSAGRRRRPWTGTCSWVRPRSGRSASSASSAGAATGTIRAASRPTCSCHLMTTIHYVMGATVPETVVAHGADYRRQKTHEVPDTLTASAVYGKEQFMVGLERDLQQLLGGESGFAIMGNEGSLTFRGSRMTFTPERRREGNDWIVTPGHRPSRRPTGPIQRCRSSRRRTPGRRRWKARASPGARWGPTRPCSTWPASSTRAHAQAVGAGRARRPPRGRRRAHGERVDQAQGPRQLGLREGRPAEGLSCDVAAS